ncbi:MAG TPA: type IV pilus secretin PilQ, partial [Burkholderiaceae bacterium]|nr:type IV pilus secretin PilQ [Burkholderiaceae bacterium]
DKPAPAVKASARDDAAAAEVKAAASDDRKPAPTSPGVEVFTPPVASGSPATDRAQATVTRPATTVRAVRAEAVDGGALIYVDADGAAQYKDFLLADPYRIVVDITGVRSAFGNRNFAVGGDLVDRVRVGQPSAGVVRIVVDVKSKVSYRVARQGGVLVIAVGNADSASLSEAFKPITVAQAQAQQKPEVKVAGQRIESEKSAPAQETGSANPPANLTAQVNKTTPASLAQPNAQPAPATPAPVKETVINTGTPAVTRSVAEQRPAQPQRAMNPPATVAGPGINTTNRAAQDSRSDLAFCDPGYVGGLISFDLRSGVDVRDMLRFISQQYGINFIVDKSVGAVPVDIRVNDIPWNQVIEAVLRANRLGAVCESNGRIIRLATLEAIKEEQSQQLALREEEAKLIPLETKILHLRYARAAGTLGSAGSGQSGRSSSGGSSIGGIGSATGSGSILSIAKGRLSKRGTIEIDPRTNSLIVTDLPENIKAVENIISQLDKPEPQVEIEARIVIASRNFLRDIGMELASAVSGSNGKLGLFETSPVAVAGRGLTQAQQNGGGGNNGGNNGNNGDGDSNQQRGIGPNLLGIPAVPNLRAASPTSILSLTTGLFGTAIISSALSLQESKGQIRTIASPRITAQDNQTAEIVNGVQIPVQTVSNNTVTTTFVTAALRLEITPQIVEETGEVLMHVVAENNTVNLSFASLGGTPGINTQSAESTVRVQDGGTTIMGGINIDNESHTQNRTPGISRVPVLGELFKRRTTRRDYDEILFFLTPRIIRSEGMTGPRSLAPQRSSAAPEAASPASSQRAQVLQLIPVQPQPQQKAAKPASGEKGGK